MRYLTSIISNPKTQLGGVLDFCINHMTVPRLTIRQLSNLAAQLNCIGIELRNDLSTPLFDGDSPESAAPKFQCDRLRLLALSEIKFFDDFSDQKLAEASALVDLAKRCKAEAVTLIPRNDGGASTDLERKAQLHLALGEIKPVLKEAGLRGLVEPLGFATCSLRYKSEAVDAINAVDGADVFHLVHDTFHHYLAKDTECFPEHTAMVHISGVSQPELRDIEMHDEHRVLVDCHDRLGNVTQIRKLLSNGYTGPISFEAFAPQIHSMQKIEEALANSMNYIKNGL